MSAFKAWWDAGLTGKHYAITVPSDGSVACTPDLDPGLYECQAVGDNMYVKRVPGETTSLPSTNGDECAFVRDGGGVFVIISEHGPENRVAVKAITPTLSTLHVQRRG